MSRRKLKPFAKFHFYTFIITFTLLPYSFLRLVQCESEELRRAQSSVQLAYSRLHNLTYHLISTKLVQNYSFCIRDPEDDWDKAFNYSHDLSFLIACLAKYGDVTRRLCTAAEVEVYFNNLRSGGKYMRPNRNCNSSHSVPGCEPGWACSTDVEEPIYLKNYKVIPARGLNCESCCEACPLGSYCPLATLDPETGKCKPYSYQLPPGQPNHTCGGAHIWADARTNSELFCSAGSYCPASTASNNCSSGNYCPMGSTGEKRCFKLATCDSDTESQNIHAYGVILIVALSTLFLIIYNCTDQILTTRQRRYAKSREAAARTMREKSRARAIWKAAKNHAIELQSQFSDKFSKTTPTKEDDFSSIEVFDTESKEKDIHTHSQIFKYAFAQLEKEKAQQQKNKNLTFSGVISMALKNEIRIRPLIEITFRDVTVTLKGTHKNLLRSVTGKIKPGHITAIMGPSGAGKTTFLSALAGKAVGCRVSGMIFMNGKAVSIHSYRKIIGFVPQDDIVHGNLTVEENLWFSARCRLSADLPKPDKVLIVERVIDSLGLQAIRGSLVGTVEKRGISGGQRKRVNVGLELVIEPSLYALFQMFDDLILLAKGGLTVYHGSVKKVEKYFAGLGIHVPERVNPPDYFIDILEGMVKTSSSLGVSYTELPVRWMLYNGYPIPSDMRINTAAPALLMLTTNIEEDHGFPGLVTEEQSFAGEVWQDVKASVEQQHDMIRHNFLRSTDLSYRRTPSPLLQYKYFLGRLREAKTQAVDYLILLIAGACLGSLTKASDTTFGFVSYTYTIIAVSLLCKIAALRSFSLDKLQYWRESSSGISSLAYFVSKDTVDLFNVLIKPVVYLSMFYFFSNPRSSFACNYIVLLCLVYCVTGMAYALVIFLEPGPSQLCSVLLPVVLTLIATQSNASGFVLFLGNFCYPKWALEAFVIANAERYYGVWLLTRCGELLKYGYNVHHWNLRLLMLIITGIICRVVAFIVIQVDPINQEHSAGPVTEQLSFCGEFWLNMKYKLEARYDVMRNNFLKSKDLSRRRTPNILLQYKHFLGRMAKQRLRDARIQAIDFLILLLAGACLGLLAKGSEENFGAPALLCKIAALRTFSLDKLQYQRERASGISSLAHFIAKDTVDHFNTLIKPLVYLSMFYFFSNPRSLFLDNYIVLLCLVYCVTGIAYALAIFLEPVVLTLLSTQPKDSKFIRILTELCYPSWALEAFIISNAKRYYGVWLIQRCGALMRTGYNLHNWYLCISLLMAAGAACRALAFFGDLPQRLCTAADLRFYFSNFIANRRSSATFLQPNRNCNHTSWVSGCEPGWACSSGPNQPVNLRESREIPERTSNCQPCCEGFFCPQGLTCMIPCPLGSYCPLATLNGTTGLCDPYPYQLPPGEPNHTCGGANIWADVSRGSSMFCSAGSYCPTNTEEIPCGSGRNARSREVAVKSVKENAQAQARWQAAKDAIKKRAIELQSQVSRSFSHSNTIIPYKQARISNQTEIEEEEIEERHDSFEDAHQETVNKDKKKKLKVKHIRTDTQIFKYAYSQLEKEKAQQQKNENLTFSGVIAMTMNDDTPTRPPIEISFRDLTVSLKQTKKHLLQSLTGEIKPGRITALMGPSGAGKTTLLSALAGKTVGCTITGLILINGKMEPIRSYKKIVGFVPQDDVVHGNLTVEENIWFSANCRLSADLLKKDKVLIVERVIESLGLQPVRDSLVGTVEKRGISGGQRKRVNVGLELVMEPSLLFLDEPTSGLDSSSSQLLLRALRREAHEGGGRTVYHGSVTDVEDYFALLGINVPERINPPDYFIDVLEEMVKPSTSSSVSCQELPLKWMIHKGYPIPADMQQNGSESSVPVVIQVDPINEGYSAGPESDQLSFCGEFWQNMKYKLEARYDVMRNNFLSSKDLSKRRTPNILLQYKHFLGRIQAIDFLILMLAGACLGLLARGNEENFGAPALLCKIAALRTFSLDKLQYQRERASGISSLAHFIAKDTVDHFNTLIKPLVYLSMFYFFSNPRSLFLDNYIVLLCLVYCVTGIAYALAIFLEPGPSQLRCGALMRTGYNLHNWYLCISLLMAAGAASRALAFFGMLARWFLPNLGVFFRSIN
ncbi:hypothetical protein ACJIZ3_022898 [Penstemon smallii]|uniref:ABC transporter domain-containing protein n=1 Tax=Penstemon smallii TaxID=265156 RepID=A0ABD3TMJ6_9LAMI